MRENVSDIAYNTNIAVFEKRLVNETFLRRMMSMVFVGRLE